MIRPRFAARAARRVGSLLHPQNPEFAEPHLALAALAPSTAGEARAEFRRCGKFHSADRLPLRFHRLSELTGDFIADDHEPQPHRFRVPVGDRELRLPRRLHDHLQFRLAAQRLDEQAGIIVVIAAPNQAGVLELNLRFTPSKRTSTAKSAPELVGNSRTRIFFAWFYLAWK